ncbi:flagellin lysine-N-methylase [[Clostridium] symbiosum]|uniref:flagellin lysine-N-methylase n=1 Tax=Clostridium symbiosum TaxID=1512 RepID=UPI001D07EF75|nr:flagellin lysine-N-methylase [[Clostridium] symbiosum]MCB6611184.1 flagellin lysine-N-methylase [[Clostridium] symbiosum]MCB6933301.1 flagellin lysine-N-methylase [[Clostridium] symbiosum]
MSGKKRTLVRKPDYFDRFRCTASACSDNCCIGWEIDIDEKTAGRYKNVSGELGKKLREMISWPGGEEIQAEEVQAGGSLSGRKSPSDKEPPHFILQEERCPFLDRDNLCELIRKLGEESLCDICREHPRYYEWFDGLTEKGVGLCCEAAAGLILESSKKAEFVTELEEQPECGPLQGVEPSWEGELLQEANLLQKVEPLQEGKQWDPLLTGLLAARETAFQLLQNREIPLNERLALYLMFSEDIQDYLSMYADSQETLPQEDGGEADTGEQAGGQTEAKTVQAGREVRAQTVERIREIAEEYGDPEFISGLLNDCREDDKSGSGNQNRENEKGEPEHLLPEKERNIAVAADRYRTILQFLRTLEPVSEQWPELLGRLEGELESVLAKQEEFSAYFKEREYQYEHLAVYFTYRYYLKSCFDCDLLSRAVFTVASVLVIRLFDMEKYAGTGGVTSEEQIELVRYYSRELEYSLENLEAFSEEVWEGETFALEDLLELLFT